MRLSFFLKKQAVSAVREFLAPATWDECEKHVGRYTIKQGAADCNAFPLPLGFSNWHGETSAYYVYDADMNEVLAVAYWQEEEYAVQCRETGDLIETCLSLQKAREVLARFYAEDEKDGILIEDIYEISRWDINENRYIPVE